MLQVKDVRKKYVTGDFEQIALNGVSLNLRDNEFVAILGPSGSGKTTLLNIIGGLDRYDSGDLIIDGVCTKKYKDRDWDSYRNHTVGFVFQSYNLIPHQTVLANVELALTIGGISASQRKEMALAALDQVGLKEQAHKKPNQMSGGQMQRVAIARALVNNPKILLADEPTGALDTKTSVQVMDLLKEVAKDRLVVMVTHNPELAEQYANRIVRVKDGNLVSDSNPLVISDETPAVHKNLGKASMSLLTSFGLSLNNLMTKKGRTFLTAFAGSIGIIGIALILSLSTGFQNYIDQIQEETMTSYPLTIYKETSNAFATILTMTGEEGTEEPEEGTLMEQQFLDTMIGSVSKNDLEYFKDYLDTHKEEYEDNISLIKYTYSVTPLIYTVDAADNLAQINPNKILSSYMGTAASYMSSLTGSSSMTSPFSEITDLDMMKDDYTLLAGNWPENYNEMIAVVSDPNQISDMLLYTLGLRDTKEFKTILQDAMTGEGAGSGNEPMTITYEDLMNLELRLIDPSDLYRYNEQYGTYEDMSDDDEYMEEIYENAEPLKIVGIAYSEDNSSTMSAGVMYLPELTYHVMEKASESEIVKKQLEDKDTDVFSGKAFDDEEDDSSLDFQDMISIDEDALADAFQTNIDTSSLSGLSSLGSSSVGLDEEQMASIIMEASSAVTENLEGVTQSMVTAVTTVDSQVAEGLIEGYTSSCTVSLPVSVAEAGTGGNSGDSAGSGTDVSQIINEVLSFINNHKDDIDLSQLQSIFSSLFPQSGSQSGSTSGTESAAGTGSTDDSDTSGGFVTQSYTINNGNAGNALTEAMLLSADTTIAPAEPGWESLNESTTAAAASSGTSSASESSSTLKSSASPESSSDSFLEKTSSEAGSSGADSSASTASGSFGNSLGTAAASETDTSNETKTFSETVDSNGTETVEETETSDGTEAESESDASSDTSASETRTYLVVSYGGVNMPEIYKSQAMTSEVFENLVSQMSEQMGGLSISSANMKKVAEDAFDIYVASLNPNANGLVPVDELPDPSSAVQQAIKNNEALLFKESYDLAKQYTTMMVAAGISQAVGNIMTPVMSGLSSSLSGLSGLSDMFSGDILTIDQDKFAEAFNFDMDEDELTRLMESMMTGETASYSTNLQNLGYQDINSPTSISFYFKDFESKGNFTDWLENYNDIVDEDKQMTYSDITGILMGSVETIINSVTYVLIAFVSISLIVSSIMIGIITYISVLERTKEIGILRAIGASKHNISSIFNAETFIIGFLSGLIGIATTYLLNIPINIVIHQVSGNPDIIAVLNPVAAVILVVISTVLTMFGGLLPSKSASRKDPVIALRTE